LAAASLLVAQCAFRPPGPEAFSFGVTGDTPYNAREEPAFMETIARMNGEALAFVVHVGDIKSGGNSPCTDELFLQRKAQFDTSRHPFVLTPGDNDWTDCRRESNGKYDVLERLQVLRRIFFPDGDSLGTQRMATETQDRCLEAGEPCRCGPYPENRLWESHAIVFATINVPGSNNNRGFDAASDNEADCRDRANLAWLAIAERRTATARALVVFTQADLWVGRGRTFAPYQEALVDIAGRLHKPVLFVHGDTHIYRYDTPFKARDGTPVANPARLEVYGSPFVGWVKVDVDGSRPDIFTVDPRLTRLVP
jgi:hypothetical protein